jgi:hypothetical protein
MDAGAAEKLAHDPLRYRRVYLEIEFLEESAIEGSNKLRAKMTKIDVFSDKAHHTLLHAMKPQ